MVQDVRAWFDSIVPVTIFRSTLYLNCLREAGVRIDVVSTAGTAADFATLGRRGENLWTCCLSFFAHLFLIFAAVFTDTLEDVNELGKNAVLDIDRDTGPCIAEYLGDEIHTEHSTIEYGRGCPAHCER